MLSGKDKKNREIQVLNVVQNILVLHGKEKSRKIYRISGFQSDWTTNYIFPRVNPILKG